MQVKLLTFSLSKERASTTTATSEERHDDTMLAQGWEMMFWLEIQSARIGNLAFIWNSVHSSYRHLVAILKEDKETFGFEIQVRLK